MFSFLFVVVSTATDGKEGRDEGGDDDWDLRMWTLLDVERTHMRRRANAFSVSTADRGRCSPACISEKEDGVGRVLL